MQLQHTLVQHFYTIQVFLDYKYIISFAHWFEEDILREVHCKWMT